MQQTPGLVCYPGVARLAAELRGSCAPLEGRNLASYSILYPFCGQLTARAPQISPSGRWHRKHFVEASTKVPPPLQPVGCCLARCVGVGALPISRGLTSPFPGRVVMGNEGLPLTLDLLGSQQEQSSGPA